MTDEEEFQSLESYWKNYLAMVKRDIQNPVTMRRGEENMYRHLRDFFIASMKLEALQEGKKVTRNSNLEEFGIYFTNICHKDQK